MLLKVFFRGNFRFGVLVLIDLPDGFQIKAETPSNTRPPVASFQARVR